MHPPAKRSHWEQMDWSQCEQKVRRLQARIVKATQEGRWGKVKALQWLLTHSFSGKALAVKRVTENQGKRHAGSGRSNLEHSGVQIQGHRHVATARLSTATAAACLYPESQWEAETAGNPHDERPRHAGAVPAGAGTHRGDHRRSQLLWLSTGTLHRRRHRAVLQCAVPKAQSRSGCLEGDIRGCFDNISHEWMLDHIPTDKEVLRKWLKAGFMENRTLFPTEAGTPQGGIISPTLANLTLDGLERLLKETFRMTADPGKVHNPKVNLVRYADDFIITGELERAAGK